MPIPKGYRRKRLVKDWRKYCQKGTVRTVKSGSARVLVCRPHGKTKMRAISIDKPVGSATAGITKKRITLVEGKALPAFAGTSSTRAAFLRYSKSRLKPGTPGRRTPSWRAGRGCRKFSAAALTKGTRIEFKEHRTLGKRIVKQIAREHLCRNPKYYSKER